MSATALIPASQAARLIRRPALDRNPAAVYLATLLSEGSRRTMRQALGVMATMLHPGCTVLDLPWAELRYQHVAALRSRLAGTYAPATASKMLCALRGVLRQAWKLEQIPEADYRRAIDVKGVRGETLPAGRALTLGEIGALLEACARDTSAAGARDAAAIAVLYACGLRRSEVIGLDLADYDVEASTLRIRRAKGRKDRSVPLANGAAAAVRDWLAVRGELPGPLLVPVDKAGRQYLRRLSSQAVYNLLRKRGGEAGVKDFSPHDFRRTMISHLLDANADLVTVSKLVGHESVLTTGRYDRRGEEAKRQAVELLHLPYRGRAKAVAHAGGGSVNQLLLDPAARSQLSLLLAGVERPAEISTVDWYALRRGRVAAVPVAMFATLCDCLWPQDVVGILQRASLEAAEWDRCRDERQRLTDEHR